MNRTASDETDARLPRRLREDGVRSRAAILREAANLATIEGIDGLSLSRIATAVGMSKSGIYAHFGSKQELQLATISVAEDIFTDEVLNPAADAEPGVERLIAVADHYLNHVRESIFPGGCFFASAMTELGARPGEVRDRALATIDGWVDLLESQVRAAQGRGQIDPAADAKLIAFEINSYMFLANAQFIARDDPAALERGLAAVKERLVAAAPA